MINWTIQVMDWHGGVLLDTCINPTTGSEGKDMLFRVPPGVWAGSGQIKNIHLLKDGAHVATIPDSNTVRAGRAYSFTTVLVAAHRWHLPKSDVWELQVEDNHGNILVLVPVETAGTEGKDFKATWKNTQWAGSGLLSSVHLLKNGSIVASLLKHKVYPFHVVAGGSFVADTLRFIEEDWHGVIPAPDTQRVVCDCGGWATYGRDANIHEDSRFFVCSLRKAGM